MEGDSPPRRLCAPESIHNAQPVFEQKGYPADQQGEARHDGIAERGAKGYHGRYPGDRQVNKRVGKTPYLPAATSKAGCKQGAAMKVLIIDDERTT